MVAGPAGAAPPRPRDLLLDGFALVFTSGRPAAGPVLREAASAFAGPDVSVEEVLRWGWLATAAAVFVWDHDTCLAVSTRAAQLARDAGALEVLVVAVNVLAQAEALGGDFAAATFLIAEADAITEATGASVAPYGALVLGGAPRPGGGGVAADRATIRDATPGGQGTAVQYAYWARAVLMNGLSRYDEALAAAITASEDTPELFVSMWSLSELVEAAARTGDIARAARALARSRTHTRDSDADGRSASGRACAALLSEGDADDLFREAIDRLRPTRLRPELAPPHLLYGEWLRREAARRRPRAAAHGPRAAHRDGDGGVRRARPPRARGDGRQGAQADGRDARRPHARRSGRSHGSRATGSRTRRSARGCS